jgi:hypothetical protein
VVTPVRDRPQIDWANSPSPPPLSSLGVERAAVPRYIDPTFRQSVPHRASPLGRTPPVTAAHSPPRRDEVEGDDVDIAQPGAPRPPPPVAPSTAFRSATLTPQMQPSATTMTASAAGGGGDVPMGGSRAALPRKSLSGGGSTKTRRMMPRKVRMISVEEAGQLLKASGHTLEDD